MPPRLDELVEELREADRRERIELLIDLARTLKPLPERLEAHKDATHRVEECQSPVYLFAERAENADAIALFADVPPEAPTVRGFVAMLIDGLDGCPRADFAALPNDILDRAGIAEILGMQRTAGLNATVRRLKAMAARS